MPLPNEETTPPVTKMYFVSITIILCYGLQNYKNIPQHKSLTELFHRVANSFFLV